MNNKSNNNAEQVPTPMSLVYVKNRSSKVWSIGHYIGKKGKWFYIAEMDEVGFDEMSVSNPYEDAAENDFDVFMKKHGGNIKVEIELYTAVKQVSADTYRKSLVVKARSGEITAMEHVFNYHYLSTKGYSPDKIVKHVTTAIIEDLTDRLINEPK